MHAIVFIVEPSKMIFTKYAPSSPPPFHPLSHYVDINFVSTCSFPDISRQLRLAATCSGPMGNHTCGSGRVSSDAIDRQLNGNFTGHSSLSSRQAPLPLSALAYNLFRPYFFIHLAQLLESWHGKFTHCDALGNRCRGRRRRCRLTVTSRVITRPTMFPPFNFSFSF
jgi:hypothetical protein